MTSEEPRQRRDRVAVVVVLYNSAPLLPDLVESLPAGLTGVDFELVGVDNASPDSSVETLLELAPWATVVRTGRNGGYAAGINAGVAAARPHDAVLVLNSDVRLRPGCVAALLEGLQRTGAGIAVPRLLDADGALIDSLRREPTVLRAIGDAVLGAQRAGRFATLGENVTDLDAYGRAQRSDWAEGSTQLISRECWETCGPWDESFFLYCEETEFDLRARDLGFSTWLVPEAQAVHLEGGSGLSDRLWVLQVTNRVRLFRRRHGRVAVDLYWAATLLREATRAMLGRSNSRAATRALLRRGDVARSAPTPAAV
ncbi:Glycosyltransferase, GT2 family [Microlunatus sagamiharensis]|uniref:Glycosyltransferase, GT2 family n=1 Tax=Microlunatus sagamiharensis TaxID=546874 RepID=A0A1H2LTP7_9ACTN|nr:glycosyltransferase family 2 protein [Microlunatus sagamiharensis]SDU84319.1 Glycosyltransferase, GT2 family [Microlunatus sagamiharensis]